VTHTGAVNGKARRRVVQLVVAMASVAFSLWLPAASARATLTWQPVYNHDFPDPSVMTYNQTEYAYSTNSGVLEIPWASSVDSVNWQSGGTDALPSLPAWAAAGATWAPSVEQNGAGQFVMFYAARDVSLGTHCIGRATSTSPTGPFVDVSSSPIVCQPSAGGSIDPDIFTAPGGSSYLYWKSDGNSIGKVTDLWGAPLDADFNVVGPPTLLLSSDQPWQAGIIEAPSMAYLNGTYELFYSANAYASSSYGIGDALCTGPLGPCSDSPSNPALSSAAGMSGPGSPSVFQAPNGQWMMAFDAWPGAIGYSSGGYRALYMATVSTGVSGQPVLSPVGPGATPNIPIRVYGQDSVGTSIATSQAEFPLTGSAGGVVLARSDFFSDALAGGPLAAKVGGPLLITPGASISSVLDPRVLAEIQRVLPAGRTVYILGGTLALSPNIDRTLANLGYTVVREAGADEYQTAVDISETLGDPSTVFLATGLNFYDALSSVPAAIDKGAAILLTDGGTQSFETGVYLAQHPMDSVFAIGGPAFAADPSSTPIYGQDLFSTAAAVAATFFPHANVYGVATDASFADALGGGVFTATGNRLGPMLLIDPNATTIAPSIAAYLSTLPPTTQGFVFGGPLAVPSPVVGALEAAAG
jgi:hypothetical protein